MTIDSEDAEELEKRRICFACVGEKFLSESIEKEGKRRKCYYCSNTLKTISIGELADSVSTALDEHYYRTSTDPEPGLEWHLQKEGLWERAGETVAFVISEMAEIEEEPAEDIRKLLEYQNYDIELARMSEESPYEEDAHYAPSGPNCAELLHEWAAFERSVQTESRFFSRVAQAILDRVFCDIWHLRTSEDHPVTITAGPEASLNAIYRARVFQTWDQLEEALKRPDRGLGPPPWRLASAGRMNPQGIAVFYGATTEAVAIAEVRPPVGSRVAVARFEIIRSLHLLDVEALRDVLAKGSVFDPSYIRRLEHAKFLERLSQRISQPVVPHDEPFDYLVTQAIAEYLSELTERRLDGVIFRSAQSGNRDRNIVLFHHAARVSEMDLPEGTELSCYPMTHSDEEDDFDYCVWEEVPAHEETQHKEDDDSGFLSPLRLREQANLSDRDDREETLRVNLQSVVVHHVEAVNYDTRSVPVSRHRQVKGDDPF